MAYTPGFLYDIYIGHSTVDEDDLWSPLKGWVENFVEKLKFELDKRLGSPVRIYRNKDAGLSAAKQPNAALMDSAVFIAPASAKSPQSDLCKLELEKFEEKLSESVFSLLLDSRNRRDHERVIHLFREPREFLSGDDYFNFHPGQKVSLQATLERPSFDSRLSELTDVIANVLRSLKDESKATSLNKIASPQAIKFIGSLKDDSKATSLDKNASPQAIESYVRSLVDSTSPEEGASLPADFAWEPSNNPSTDAGLVFVSYSKKDKTFAHDLAKNLKKRGVRVWVDEWDIPVGAESWRKCINEGLTKCDSVLIVFSPSAVDSREVNLEADIAMNMRKPIVPLLHQSCEIPPHLNVRQHIDFISVPPNDDEKMEKLVRGLKAAKK